MSAQDIIEPASPSKSDSINFQNCTHDHTSSVHSTSPKPPPPTSGIRPHSPQVNIHPQSPKIKIKNQPTNLNCNCAHHSHRNILIHQHYHRYPVSSGSGTGSNPSHRHSTHVTALHTSHHSTHENEGSRGIYMRQHSSCECGNSSAPEQSNRSSRVMSGEEINQSEIEDNNRRCCQRPNKKTCSGNLCGTRSPNERKPKQMCSNPVDEMKFINRIEQYSEGEDSGVKVTDGATSEEELGPPLPPRPPLRPRTVQTTDSAPHGTGLRKYVVWCLICGGISCLLGIMFLGIYFLVRSYTSTVGYFETVPTFVPATLLMLTGLCIISLARRRNRYSYLIKLSGACGLASALTCALVTVTTTVLHMSRLQALKECEYTKKTRTCTCYPIVNDPQQSDDGVDEVAVRFVFDSSDECTIVHSALYACLRAIFGLSVAGVLVAVFSCMLVYQLLSHERKKMYWEQLELRCRSLYAGPQPPPPTVTGAPSIIGTPRGGPCRCCEQCHSHRNAMPSAYPWDSDNRFWTPAPGQPGNFYSPNPGGDDNMNRVMAQAPPVRNQRPGWSWPRLPWQRSDAQRFRQTPSSPDSQYGFSNVNSGPDTSNLQGQPTQGGYTIIGGPPHYGVWGPPPPYSDPNSPARRGRYQYINPVHCQPMIEHNVSPQQSNLAILECHQHSSSADSHTMEPFCPQQQQHQSHRQTTKRQNVFKSKENYDNAPSDSDGPRDRFSNTLPIRKTKKRVEIGANSIGPNQPASRVNVQNVFNNVQQHQSADGQQLDYHDAGTNDGVINTRPSKQQRSKAGVENSGFMSAESDGKIMEPTESEVYFADVSSCCNMSIKNDNLYDETNQRRIDKFCKDENEDYLVQRFGNRETSIRSRLPFPQVVPENYEKPQMNIPIVASTQRPSLMHKDISRQSMCSVDSGEKTDFTDLSPATPCSAFGTTYTIEEKIENGFQQIYPTNPSTGGGGNGGQQHYKYKKSESTSSGFVSSYSYSSSTEQGASDHHQTRRSNIQQQEIFLAPVDVQYEIIKDTTQFVDGTNSNSIMKHTYDHEMSYNNSQSSHFHKPKSPKNINLTPIKRQNIGANISTIIQNLGGSDVGLLYSDNRREDDINQQDCIISGKNKTISDNEWSDHSDRRL